MSSAPLALFRRLSNGVYVIGVSHGSRSNAFTAAWITQAHSSRCCYPSASTGNTSPIPC